MSILTDDMKRVVRQQRLAFVATVCPDNTPNVSPKGCIAVWGDDHLVFANIRSPRTISNLRHNPAIEINVIDPFVRKGYRFKGTATVVEAGARYEEITAFFRARGVQSPILEVVVVTVERATPVTSPAYDRGVSEAETRARWERHHEAVKRGTEESTGE
ncbi:MAG: pyridoxamine 5'-phosphate oxidase family protein [Deltaproteobacteria bacterium]|nr:pyridoxamine 5'-phosphate oxidase family protein [Deltaproteobacteria bacterium]MBI3391244.1 pyridoxamine 5'-phosphate oxidase family protein [Deltaproteobacteria bacterium]